VTDSISILIIEGEPNLRRECASALTEVSFTVADVRDYPEALLKLDKFKPDIAIVDEALPSGDGKDICHKLRNDFGIPVILLGVGSGGEAWMRAVEAGADFYFRKSFSYQELVARVKAILRGYKLGHYKK
jgi:DNA-binding response OmpR family regulator